MKASNPVDEHVGDLVRSRRIALDLRQEQLAEALGVTVRQIREWEAGARRIGADRLLELTGILHVSPVFFFAGAAAGGLSREVGPTPPSPSALSAAHFVELPRLIHAFAGIGDPAFRAVVIELAERLAGTATDTPYM